MQNIIIFIFLLFFISTGSDSNVKKISLESIQVNTECGENSEGSLYFTAQVYGTRAETPTIRVNLETPSSFAAGQEYNINQELIYWKYQVGNFELPILRLELFVDDGTEYPPLLATYEIDWSELPLAVLGFRQVKVFHAASADPRCTSESTAIWLWSLEVDPEHVNEDLQYIGPTTNSSRSNNTALYFLLIPIVLCCLCTSTSIYCCISRSKSDHDFDDNASIFSGETIFSNSTSGSETSDDESILSGNTESTASSIRQIKGRTRPVTHVYNSTPLPSSQPSSVIYSIAPSNVMAGHSIVTSSSHPVQPMTVINQSRPIIQATTAYHQQPMQPQMVINEQNQQFVINRI